MQPPSGRGRGRPPRLAHQVIANVNKQNSSQLGQAGNLPIRPSLSLSSSAPSSNWNPPIRPPSLLVSPNQSTGFNLEIDILANLSKPQQSSMRSLMEQFKLKVITIQEFMNNSRILLGEQLFALMTQGMNRAVAMKASIPPSNQPSAPPNRPVGRPPLSATNQEEDSWMFDMTTGGLQDVIQYAGIDLKAESEMISKDHEHIYNYQQQSPTSSTLEGLFNITRLKALMHTACAEDGCEVSEEATHAMILGLRERLANILADLIEASKHRCDAYFRMPYKIKIENDPKKQIWIIDKLLTQQDLKLSSLQNEEGGGNEKEIAPSPMSAAGMMNTAAPTPSNPTKSGPSTKKPRASAGEEAIVKTKLANITAMTILGVQQKSWMTQAAASAAMNIQQQSTSSLPTTSLADNNTNQIEDNLKEIQMVNVPLHFSQAPSMIAQTDRELLATIKNRSITIKDLVWLAEQDRYLRSTYPLLQILYDMQ